MRKTYFLFIGLLTLSFAVAAATFESAGSGAWNNKASWTLISGTDSDSIPDNTDDATILSGHVITNNVTWIVRNLTVEGTFQGLSGNLMYIYGNYINNGTETGIGGIAFAFTSTGTISGTGTFGASIGYTFQTNRTILAGTTIYKTGNTSIANGVIIRNHGNYTIGLTSSGTTSRWVNEANSTLTLRTAGFFATAGILEASAAGNTVNVNYGTGALPRCLGYMHLNINGSGVKTIPFALNVGGNFSLAAYNTLNLTNYTATFGGNIISSGSIINSDTVNLEGSSVQFIGGSAMMTLKRVFVDGAGVSLFRNLSVTTELTFLQGNITTNTNRVILFAGATTSASQSNGWVNGNLQSAISTGNYSRTFVVGNATSYLPVTLAFNSVTTGGDVTAFVTDGDHPNIAPSCIDQTQSVNHYWTLTNSSTVFSNYSATFGFSASNYDAGADPTMFYVGRFVASSSFVQTPGTRTSTTTEAIGITAFGSFAVGELKTPTVTVQPTDATSSCAGTNVNFTATVVGGLSTSYQWIEDQGSGFASITNGGVYSGATTNTLTLTGVTANMGGYRYALLINHACGTTVSTDTVTLYVYPAGAWNGSVNTDWHTPGNWCGGVPTATTDAIVYSVTNLPVLSASATTRNLQINLGATVDLNGQTLAIGGQLSGDGFIKGSSTSNLSFSGSSVFSTLLMDQTSSSTRMINNLTVNIPSGGVTMGNALDLGGVLTVTDGNIHSNGQSVTLLSTASGTSRIAPVGATASLSGGSFNIQRYLSSRDSGYVEMSSTVQGSTISDWDQELNMYGINGNEGNPSSKTFTVYGYDETVWDYVPVSNSGEALTPGEGFFVFLFDMPANIFTSTTAVTTGTPNFGGISYPITRNNDGWNFVGNPYHSFISWAAVKAANPTLAASFQSYDDGINDFQTFNSGEIPPGHGFWVETSSSTTLSLPESIKTTSTGSQFGRIASHQALQVKLSDNFSKSSHIVKLITEKSATSHYDFNLDASFIQQKRTHFPSFYAMTTDNRKVVINAIGTADAKQVTPLVVKATASGVYTFEFSGISYVNGYDHVYFMDEETNELYDLKKISTVSASIEEGKGEGRFSIIMSREAIKGIEPSGANIVLARTENGANIMITKETESPVTISVFNTLGQEVLNPVVIHGSNMNLTIDLPVKNQYYFVRIQGDHGTSTKKLFY